MKPSLGALRIAPVTHFDRLLGLCARGDEHPELHALLRAASAGYAEWDTLATRAEVHGIAPLVRHHLRAAGVEMPQPIMHTFVGLEMRHRRMNALRARLLAELCSAFEARSVPLLLLKGAALAFQIYPQPGLRTMRDIDVLVRLEDLRVAAEIFVALGYGAQNEATWVDDRQHHHHQPARTRVVEGSTFTVEVHRLLGIEDASVRRTLDVLWDASVPVAIGGASARTLGPTDMLLHLYHHGFTTRLSWPDRFRLVSLADLVTLVDAEHARIDWQQLRERHAHAWQALAWTQRVTPWSQAAREASGLPLMAAVSGDDGDDLGRDYTGWPRERVALSVADKLALVRDTALPPAWWLHMRHGGKPGALGRAQAWLRHAVDVLRPSP